MKCETCKWWTRKMYTSDDEVIPLNTGECANPAFFKSLLGRQFGARVFDTDISKNFGCVHHSTEVKP